MRWLLFLSLLLTVAFTPADPEKQRSREVNDAINDAVAYLEAEYARGAFGLLPESPGVRRNKYWVATDNQVAVYALHAAGQHTFARRLIEARQRLGAQPHGLVEALAGKQIEWQPHQEHQYVLVPGKSPPAVPMPNVCSKQEDAPENIVCQEIRDYKLPTFSDWQDYADLALYGALEAYNRGDHVQAHERYQHAMTKFKNGGFVDKTNEGNDQKLYATYKLALALYVGTKLGKPTNATLLTALLSKQDQATGGFVTLYDSHGACQGDSNTETTAYALLALVTIKNGHVNDKGELHCP
jgi:hypothetical protein